MMMTRDGAHRRDRHVDGARRRRVARSCGVPARGRDARRGSAGSSGVVLGCRARMAASRASAFRCRRRPARSRGYTARDPAHRRACPSMAFALAVVTALSRASIRRGRPRGWSSSTRCGTTAERGRISPVLALALRNVLASGLRTGDDAGGHRFGVAAPDPDRRLRRRTSSIQLGEALIHSQSGHLQIARAGSSRAARAAPRIS